MVQDRTVYTYREVMEKLVVSRNRAYRIIRELNDELAAKGYRVVTGRVSIKYFNKRYGLDKETKGDGKANAKQGQKAPTR